MTMIDRSLTIMVLVYDGVEMADFVNPMAVFEKTNDYIEHPNTIRLISRDGTSATASNGTLAGPAVPFTESGDCDILVVPGGVGVLAAITDKKIVGFIRDRYANPALLHIVSVCSGSYLLAEAGLLDGKEATVTARLKADFIRRYPRIRVLDDSPVVADAGRIVTSGQIFMGISTAYWLIERLYGNDVLLKARARMGF